MGRKPANKKVEKKETTSKNLTTKPILICQYCGKTEKETKFYKAKNPKYQFFGRIPWCFTCIKDKYDELFKKYEDSKIAMYELCGYLDLVFSMRVYEVAKARWQESGVEIFQGYITYYNSVGGKNEGLSFADSDDIYEQINEEIQEEHGEELEQYTKDWGEGFTFEDYEYLEYELRRCKETLKCDTWSEETLLREICVKKLEIRNKRRDGLATKDALNELQNLMKTCAVDPAKTSIANAGKSLDAFGVWIKDIEEKSPAEWYKDKKKFKDIDGIEDYLKKYVMRPIKNFITGSRDFNVDKEVMIDFDKDGDN